MMNMAISLSADYEESQCIMYGDRAAPDGNENLIKQENICHSKFRRTLPSIKFLRLQMKTFISLITSLMKSVDYEDPVFKIHFGKFSSMLERLCVN